MSEPTPGKHGVFASPEGPLAGTASNQPNQPPNHPAPSSNPVPETPRPPVAWQPFTPKGIAAFAAAKLGRLFLLQVIVALIAAGAVVWFLWGVWCPSVREAIQNLPATGAIRSGELDIGESAAERLVTNRFLTFAIDAQSSRRHSFSADVFVVFRRSHYEVCSLFGCASFYYPVPNAPFNRLELEAKWGAWEPILLGIAAAATGLALLFAWWLLATLYCPAVWLLAFFCDRQLTLGGSWRLCGAALLAGALLLTAGVVAYGLRALDLIHLLIVALLHIVVPWVLIIFAVLARPGTTAKLATNPFAPGTKPGQDPAPPSASLK
jgi:hypothetical protein